MMNLLHSPLPRAGRVAGGPIQETADNSPSPNPSRKREGNL
jgi:hypothetical protein